jgi:hypothetical protein
MYPDIELVIYAELKSEIGKLTKDRSSGWDYLVMRGKRFMSGARMNSIQKLLRKF